MSDVSHFLPISVALGNKKSDRNHSVVIGSHSSLQLGSVASHSHLNIMADMTIDNHKSLTPEGPPSLATRDQLTVDSMQMEGQIAETTTLGLSHDDQDSIE